MASPFTKKQWDMMGEIYCVHLFNIAEKFKQNNYFLSTGEKQKAQIVFSSLYIIDSNTDKNFHSQLRKSMGDADISYDDFKTELEG